MKIDRTRFLLLTTTLAAATAAALATNTGCTSTSDTDAGVSDSDSGAGTGDGGTSADTGSKTDTDASDGAAACLGGADGTFACGPVGEGDDAGVVKCQTQCEAAVAKFKSGVAKDINDCLNSSPACEGADVTCTNQAIALACPDTTATTFCTGLAPKCADASSGFTQTTCAEVVSALSQPGRTIFTTCVDEGNDCGVCLNLAKAPN